MQFVTSANSVWPATMTPTVAYAQLGDLVEMLLHPKDSAFASCGFCQTLNREGATRCHTCGGSLLPSDDEEPATRDDEGPVAPGGKRSIGMHAFSDLPALRSVLMLVLMPPVMMFVGFGTWNHFRLGMGDSEPLALPERSSIESVFRVPDASVLPTPTLDELAARQLQARDDAKLQDERDDGPGLAATETERPVQRTAPMRPRPIASHQAVRAQGSPLAACSGYSFIARAVCVNRSCAQPKAAQHSECRQAIRQRQIDESRRNPTLMG